MDAHERLMTALYERVRLGGAGLGRTELMRQTFSTIEELRGCGATWIFLACRIERVRQHGIEEPQPKAEELDPHVSTGPARAAFVRIRGAAKASGKVRPAGADPPMTAPEYETSAGSPTSAPPSAGAVVPNLEFFQKLDQLKRPAS